MKKIKLGDVCQFSEDRTAVASLDETNYISTENLLPNKGGITDAATLPKTSTTPAFVAGNVLLSNIRPYFKKIWYATFDGGCSADVLILKVNKCIDAKFLYYALSEDKFFDYMTATAKGTKMPRGDKLSIMNYSVPDFSLAMQKKIAALLGALDDKIALNKKINATLEAMAKTLYDYWFVQFDFPDENGKPYKTSGGKMIYSSELWRDIPADWEVKKLVDIANIFDSRRIPLSNSERASMKGDIPYYGATGIVDYVNKSIFDGVYLLVAEEGSVETNSGNLVLQYIWGKSWVNNHAHILQGIENCSTEYLYLALQKIKTKQLMTGSIQKKVTQDKLLGIKLICPIDKSILRMFQKIISPVFTEYKLRTDENRRLVALRDWLLPMLMNGQASFKEKI